MKKKLEKGLSFVLVFAFVVMGCLLPSNITKAADAESTSTDAGNVVKVYYYNENNWDAVNIWSWTMETTTNLAKNAWPGDPMKDEGNGWFSAELEAEENIAVLFTDNAGNQTSDCTNLELGKTYWITNGAEDAVNDSGMGGGVSLVTATEPQAGWPEGPQADTETVETVATSVETTSNNVVLYVIIAAVVVVVIVAGVAYTKKKKENK